MSDKIQANHRERAAYVYVRQSKMHQVQEHPESNRRQYDLAQRARLLGFREVIVVDEDVGRSGTGSQERPGFGRLLAAVCGGQVGAVFSLEASRLARNNRDWHHLIDLCALAGTLVIDGDGVYDPRHLNDRLLLGLKGSMAEFELGLMRQRAQEALRQMIARGVVLWEVPVGFVRTEDNHIELSPDRQIQEAIRGVFAKFHELGSARQVLLWYHQEQLLLPSMKNQNKRPVVTWRLPVYKRILAVLSNPAYAGAFVHGRTQTKVAMRDGRARKTSGHRLSIDQWPVLIRDHHPAYISWEEYLRNRKQLESNLPRHHLHRTGAAKRGTALLSGLLRCARCGRILRVCYGGKGQQVVRYSCSSGTLNHGTPKCLSFGGLRVDEAVASAVLEAIQPAGIDAAIEAQRQLARHQEERRVALQLALEKARYEADRARRQYDAVEPENRLVAGTLESRWQLALEVVVSLEARLQNDGSVHELSPDQEQQLAYLGQNLAVAWHHPTASPVLKKRILRTVLEEIVVDVLTDPPRIDLQMHWRGGVHTHLQVAKNATGHHRHRTNSEVIDVVRELARIASDQSMASILNRLGYRTGTGKTWIASRVLSLRRQYDIPSLSAEAKHTWITLESAAKELQLHPKAVKRLIAQQILPARQVVPHAPWIIERVSLSLLPVQMAANQLRSARRIRLSSPGQQELPLE